MISVTSRAPVVETLCFHCKGYELDPGQGTKIPHAVQHGQKKKKIEFHKSHKRGEKSQPLPPTCPGPFPSFPDNQSCFWKLIS